MQHIPADGREIPLTHPIAIADIRNLNNMTSQFQILSTGGIEIIDHNFFDVNLDDKMGKEILNALQCIA